MSSGWDLYLYMKTLHLLGLVCCQYQQDTDAMLVITKWNRIQAAVALIVVHCTMMPMFIYGILYPKEFHLPTHSRTGNEYFVIHFLAGCLLIVLIYWYCYITRNTIIEFLANVLKFHRKFYATTAVQAIRFYFILYVLTSLSCCWMYCSVFEGSNISLMATICYTVVLSSIIVVGGIVNITYACVVKIFQISLRQLNTELNTIGGHVEDLKLVFIKRDAILTLCSAHLNYHYGRIILLMTAFDLMTAPSGPFFFITQIIGKHYEGNVLSVLVPFIVSTMWNVPWITMFCTMSLCGEITKEAKRTITILVRKSRLKGHGDKIIDKFLWKSLQQKPVLNICGFFTMERKTLFQLLASILSYMVILVQFKEMENKISNHQT